MAKGDHERMQNQVDQQGGLAQNNLNNTRANVLQQTQGLTNRANVAADRGNEDYDSLMRMGAGQMAGLNYGPSQNFGAYGGYQDFANNGGYSAQDIQDIRARDIAPTRAVYANAKMNLDRSRALSGGYSPNYAAGAAKLAREGSAAISDANTNANASIADAVRQGKLSGLGGMTNIDSALLNAQTANRGLSNQMFSNLVNLYGQAPGMAQLYGNQAIQSQGQGIQTEGLQGDIMKSILGGQNQVSNTAGNFQNMMGNIGSVAGLVGDVANVSGNIFGKKKV